MSSTQIIVGASRSFEHWHHATCCNYSVTDPLRVRTGPFSGRISARTLGPLTVSELTSSIPGGHVEVVRGAPQIRADRREQFMLLVADRGDVAFSQSGRSVSLRRGDLIIYDQARPFTMAFAGDDTSHLLLSIPRPLMAARLPGAEHLTARPIDAGSRLGALTASVVRHLGALDAGLDGDIAARVGHSALDILTATLQAELSDDAGGDGCRDPRLARARRHVVAHLEDPGLTVERIAAAQNLAVRTLYRLFAADGTTPMRFLWQQRLLASYRALAEGRIRQVTEAAFSFGFTDLSHFSRAFRNAFGHSPQLLVRRRAAARPGRTVARTEDP